MKLLAIFILLFIFQLVSAQGVRLSPEVINLGNVVTESSAAKNFYVINDGDLPVTIHSVSSFIPELQISPTGTQIAAHDSLLCTADFTPLPILIILPFLPST